MTGLISVNEAKALLLAHVLPKDVDQIAVEGAAGRHLAAPIRALLSRPPQAVSAMDGYAVRLQDVSAPGQRLAILAEAPAGQPFAGSVGAGQCVRVFTGSVIPDGADHVVIQEEVDRQGHAIVCAEAYARSQFVRRAGLDFAEGDLLLDANLRLGAGELALIAAANHATVPVWRRPRVGLLANGNELRAPGSVLEPGQIINSNPPALVALIEDWGGEAIDLGIAADTVASIQARIEQAQDIDIFVPIGGASVGDHDHMRPAFAGLGFEPVFEKIAVKPGKPTWFSKRGNQRVLGLPGNPASALVCAHLFLSILLSAPSSQRWVKAKLTDPLTANGAREQFLRARIDIDPAGELKATAAPNQDSSLIRPFVACNALIRRAPEAPAETAGSRVEALLIKPL